MEKKRDRLVAFFDVVKSFNEGLLFYHADFFKKEVCTKYCRSEHDEENDNELYRMLAETVRHIGKREIPVIDGSYDKYKENNCKE